MCESRKSTVDALVMVHSENLFWLLHCHADIKMSLLVFAMQQYRHQRRVVVVVLSVIIIVTQLFFCYFELHQDK